MNSETLNVDSLLKELENFKKDNIELRIKLDVKEFETKKTIQELRDGCGMTNGESLAYNAHMQHIDDYK